MSISYRGEIWRWGGPNSLQSLRFEYSLTAPGINDSSNSWVDVASLGMSFQHSGSGSEQDGNLNPTSLTGSISNLSLLNGQDIWIRWKDIGDAGATDHGFSVDDLIVNFETASSPVPEPATIALMGLGALAAWRKR
ncbi:MAG: PEP-CTERM sorting domain-containing protein, partial [Chlorobia bacterium]|nr:PEP-CTERM sorting domain-containing protein [Fimbriimonadaceae bacterium]